MKFRRQSYQNGCVSLDKRRNMWYFRWREQGVRKALRIGTLEELPSRRAALNKSAGMILTINSGQKPAEQVVTVNAVTQRYITEEMPERFSTRKAYLVYLNRYILPKWGTEDVRNIQPYPVEMWLNSLLRKNKQPCSGKTKAAIRALMFTTINCAMKWGYLKIERNPLEKGLVRIRGSRKPSFRPRILTEGEFALLLGKIPDEPFRTMVLLDMSLGLGCSELFGLKWSDIDFDRLTVHVQRAIVAGRVDETKTVYRNDLLPLDPTLAAVLGAWRKRSEFKADGDWVWASPFQGGDKPYLSWGVQQRRLSPAAKAAGLGAIGWHTLRHTYRSWLDSTKAPIGVQQRLMRHSDIRTTMNVYGDALMHDKREANGKVVRMALAKAV